MSGSDRRVGVLSSSYQKKYYYYLKTAPAIPDNRRHTPKVA